jgi:hypothetical protein
VQTDLNAWGPNGSCRELCKGKRRPWDCHKHQGSHKWKYPNSWIVDFMENPKIILSEKPGYFWHPRISVGFGSQLLKSRCFPWWLGGEAMFIVVIDTGPRSYPWVTRKISVPFAVHNPWLFHSLYNHRKWPGGIFELPELPHAGFPALEHDFYDFPETVGMVIIPTDSYFSEG